MALVLHITLQCPEHDSTCLVVCVPHVDRVCPICSVQDVKLAYTHRDLAQKCVGQGMLEAAQMCLLRIKPANWEVAGDTTARELMRAVARSGDKTAAMQ